MTQLRAATSAREHADAAAASAGTLEAELITAEAAATEHREQAQAEIDAAIRLAGRGGSRQASRSPRRPAAERLAEPRGSSIRCCASSRPTGGASFIDTASCSRPSRRASREAERARAEEREAAARVERASKRRAESEQQLEGAREAFTAAFAGWRSQLAELDLDDNSAIAALDLAHAGRPTTAGALVPGGRARAHRARPTALVARSGANRSGGRDGSDRGRD